MIIDCAIYEEGKRRDGRVELEHAYDGRHEPGNFVWIGLYEPTEEEFASLRREFNLHPLAVEDAIHAHQRPKVEVYDDMVFLVLKTARYVDPTEVIELGELLVFLGAVEADPGHAVGLVAKALEGLGQGSGRRNPFAIHIDGAVDDP